MNRVYICTNEEWFHYGSEFYVSRTNDFGVWGRWPGNDYEVLFSIFEFRENFEEAMV